jgi:hypothetical protein
VRIGRCGALILVWGTWFGCSLPSDASLESAFPENRNRLERIITLLREDQLRYFSTGDTETLTDDLRFGPVAQYLSPDRSRQYRQLLTEVGLEGTRWLEQDGVRVYCVFQREWSVEKGYAYRETPPHRLFESLDRHPKERIPEGEPIYKRLEGNWYLYYMYFT